MTRKRAPAKTFEVTITRDIRMHFSAEVEARDEGEAIAKAKDMANGRNAGWVEGDIRDEDERVREIGGGP